jgi:hypothetical protein
MGGIWPSVALMTTDEIPHKIAVLTSEIIAIVRGLRRILTVYQTVNYHDSMDIPAISNEGVLVLILWSLAWKAPALWRAARNGDKKWYAAMLVLSTLGVLEYIYLFIVSKEKPKSKKA